MVDRELSISKNSIAIYLHSSDKGETIDFLVDRATRLIKKLKE